MLLSRAQQHILRALSNGGALTHHDATDPKAGWWINEKSGLAHRVNRKAIDGLVNRGLLDRSGEAFSLTENARFVLAGGDDA